MEDEDAGATIIFQVSTLDCVQAEARQEEGYHRDERRWRSGRRQPKMYTSARRIHN